MRTTDVARYAEDTAYLIARGQPYESFLIEGLAELVGVDAGAGVVTFVRGGESWRCSVAGMKQLQPARVRHCLAVAPRHPVSRAVDHLGVGQAFRISDLVRLRSFWGTEPYEAMHGTENGRYPVGMALAVSAARLVFVGLQRQHRDFSDTEVEVLNRIQCVLVAALAFRRTITTTLAGLKPPSPADAPPTSAPPRATYEPTLREREVLALVSLGWTSRRIASRLGIAERTVRKHLGNVYEKGQLAGRAEAAAWWQRR